MKLLERAVGPGIELRLVSDGHLPRVRLAAGEIERILLNLAANSRDAMPGGGAIAIRTGIVPVPPGDPCLGTGWHVRIAFADSGAGMRPEIARRAAEPYFSTKRDTGTGLGLASVQALVRAAGGDLRINSRAGCGTTVSVYLPALDGAARLALPGRADRPARRPTSRPSRRGDRGRSRAAAARPRRRATPEVTSGRWLSRSSPSTSRTEPQAPAFGSDAAKTTSGDTHRG